MNGPARLRSVAICTEPGDRSTSIFAGVDSTGAFQLYTSFVAS